LGKFEHIPLSTRHGAHVGKCSERHIKLQFIYIAACIVPTPVGRSLEIQTVIVNLFVSYDVARSNIYA